MTVRIAFLRAVNLGKRRVPMSRLAAVCEDLGYGEVWTHINSGNVVFDTAGSRASVEKAMERALEDEFGFECTTFVRTGRELATVLDGKPFPVATGDTHFVTFLKKVPAAAAAKGLEELSNEVDTLVVQGADVHWRMKGKSTDSCLARRDWEKILGPLSSTSRNVTMLTKLSAKVAARVDAASQPARTSVLIADALLGLVLWQWRPVDGMVLHAHLGGQPAVNGYSGIFDRS